MTNAEYDKLLLDGAAAFASVGAMNSLAGQMAKTGLINIDYRKRRTISGGVKLDFSDENFQILSQYVALGFQAIQKKQVEKANAITTQLKDASIDAPAPVTTTPTT